MVLQQGLRSATTLSLSLSLSLSPLLFSLKVLFVPYRLSPSHFLPHTHIFLPPHKTIENHRENFQTHKERRTHTVYAIDTELSLRSFRIHNPWLFLPHSQFYRRHASIWIAASEVIFSLVVFPRFLPVKYEGFFCFVAWVSVFALEVSFCCRGEALDWFAARRFRCRVWFLVRSVDGEPCESASF